MAKKKTEAAVPEVTNVAEAIIADSTDSAEKNVPYENSKETSENISAENTEVANSVVCNDICVYIGPTIVGFIQKGTIYRGSKEEILTRPLVIRAIEKQPLIASLIIPSEELPQANIKITTPGNVLYNNYCTIAGNNNRR